jgi:hypothetical protein
MPQNTLLSNHEVDLSHYRSVPAGVFPRRRG